MREFEFKKKLKPKALAVLLGLATLTSIPAAWSASIDQAVRLHERLTGVRPTDAVLNQMVALIEAGQAENAARLALQNRFFYDLTLVNFAAPWSNVKQSALVPLNDMTATIVGLVRDDVPFTQALTADVVYVGDGALIANLPAYSPVPQNATNHYNAISASRQSLQQVLVRRTQSEFRANPDTAGVLTTQGWGAAYFDMGTNRRNFMGVMRHFWCSEMEEIHDTSVPALRIRRDVDRAPSNEPSVFLNTCLGCHATMDAAIGGTAFFDYTANQGLVRTQGTVAAKMNRNNTTYPEGFVTRDDSWMWLGGLSASQSFAKFGWRGPTSGNGLNSFASAISQSRGFSECMVKKVFKKVCFRSPTSVEKKDLADSFELAGSYNLKDLFARVGTRCMD